MTSITETPLARLDDEKRLINVNVKEGGSTPGSFLFRGDLAIDFAQPSAAAGQPPALKADQVMLCATAGQDELSFYACALDSFASLKPMADLLGSMLGASGKYFAFCSNLKFSAKYRVKLGEATFYVLPLDENPSFSELLELLKIERSTIKRRDARGKLEAVAQTATGFKASYEEISYERGLELMEAPSANA
ncbi:MAG: hypothetical protein ABW321_30060 [Polyangiales bacterium]